MDVPAFIQKLYNESEVPSEADYARRLKGLMAQKPYLTNVNWKNELIVLNSNRKSADFKNYPALLQSNGIILRIPDVYTDAPTVVAYSFNTIQDYNESMNEEFNTNWNDYIVEPITDGAIIRVWWYQDQWNVSTIKCIDAHDANWSNNRSFYDLFNEASRISELDYTRLNKNYCYTFVLRHPVNHMIIEYDAPSLVHLCTVDMQCPNFNYVNDDVGIPQVPSVEFETFETFQETLKTPIEPQVLTIESNLGYILTHKTTKNKFKFETPSYTRARELKGNVPNIKYRIIDLIKEGSVEEFLSYFPQYQDDVKFVQKRLDGLVGDLYNIHKLNAINQVAHTDLRAHTIREIQWIAKEEGFMNYARVKQYIYDLSSVRLGLLTGIPYLLHQKYFRGKKLNQPRYQFFPRQNKVLTT